MFLIIALIAFTHSTKITQGQAVSMYSYINQFLISLMSIPVGVETFTRIGVSITRDIIHARNANFVEKDMVQYTFPSGGRFSAVNEAEEKEL